MVKDIKNILYKQLDIYKIKSRMRKLLFIILTLVTPLLMLGQSPCPWVNNQFPEVTHFDGNNTPLTFDVPWANNWTIQNGPTPSNNTGPLTDVSGIGSYIYTEASSTFNTLFAFQTECFNVDNNPGMELSFFYHMYGASMGQLSVFLIETDTLNGDTTEFFNLSGDQGNLWQLAVFDLDSLGVSGDFLLEFWGETGPSFTSDIAIDNIRIGPPLVVTYGCTDTLALNFDPLAMINDSSCAYPPCQGLQNLTGQIQCTPWSPNQGQVDVTWNQPTNPGCMPTGFYRGTDLNNLQYQQYQPWNGNSFYGYIDATPVSPPTYYFIIETLDGSMDTLTLQAPNCGVGCTDPAANNFNPFAGVDDGSCEYGIQTACGDTINQKIFVTVIPDTYPSETSWEIVSTDTLGILASAPQGTYQTTGVPVTNEYCLPMGAEFTFNLQDSYGDGLCGTCFGGVDGQVVVTDACGDTIFSLIPSQGDNANFGHVTISDPYTLTECPPEWPLYGCKDINFLEYNSTALNHDPSMCITPAIPGCVDSNAFNYDPNANTMDLIPNCDYTLELFDGGGNGWDDSYIGITQNGQPIGAFTCSGNNAFYTINVSALSHVNITFYEVFNQQGTSTDVTQCGFKLRDPNNNIVFTKGTNPWLDPIEPGKTYKPTLNCGNYCIPVIPGCIDTLAYNYDSLANTLDSSCVYFPGCTDPLFIEYWTQGFVADVDDGSCSVPTILGCTDSTAFNYDPLANLDNQGCIPKTFGCTDSTMFNYDANANTDDGSCIAYIYGCTDPTAFNYDSLANTNDGSCIPVVFGCTDSTMWNYDVTANTSNGSCIPFIYGCTDSTAFNYDPTANTDDGTCYPILYGCTDSTALNYNALANTNDGSCIAILLGCTDSTAINYNSLANTDNGTCVPYIYGCTDSTAFNYDSLANTNDGSCIPFIYGCMDPTMFNYDVNANTADTCIPYVYGCTDPTAWNYDSTANTNVGCISYVYGCTDPTAFNYDPNANTDDGSCVPVVIGCTDPTALNFDSLANTNSGCIYPILGCTDPTAFNYDPNANVDDSTCVPVIIGCTDPTALNYDSLANTNNGCVYPILGCTDPNMFNYDPNANTDDGSCVPFIYGCTDPTMFNYDASANTDNGSCEPYVYGCTDSTAFNYDPLANTDNGTCQVVVYGCTDATALNYNPLANTNDNSCIPYIYGCMDTTMWNYNPLANTDNGTCIPFIYGCTDAAASNYNPLANTNDNSCYYFPGCTDPLYLEFWTQGFTADYDNGSCQTIAVYGCMDILSFNYDSLANIDDGSCVPKIFGCMDDGTLIDYDGDGLPALNYNPLANTENGSCITKVFGCTDPTMFNYDPLANVDNGSCIPFIYGCMDTTMFNYDPLANTQPANSCVPFIYGCMDDGQGNDFNGDGLPALNYDATANTNQVSATDVSDPCIAQIFGCTDSTAFNYDPLANVDNGTCIATVYGCTDEYDFQGYLYTTYPNYLSGFSTVVVDNYDPNANTDDGSCLYYDLNTVTGAGNPYWLNDTCYAWVVYEVDPYCLNNQWDAFCQNQYDYCQYGTPLTIENISRDQILVYPNPTRDIVNIKSKNDVNIDLYDLLGNHIIHQEQATEIYMGNLPAGIYDLRITFKGMIINHKVIKQ